MKPKCALCVHALFAILYPGLNYPEAVIPMYIHVCTYACILFRSYISVTLHTRLRPSLINLILSFYTSPHSIVQQMSLARNVRELQKMMVGVGVSDETALKCFTKDHALMAIQYVTSSLFQHYRLYQLLFTEEQEEEHIITKVHPGLPVAKIVANNHPQLFFPP